VLELAEADEDTWNLRDHTALIYRLWPNTVLSLVSSGHTELWEFHPESGSPDRTRVSIKFYTPGEVGSDKERNYWNRNVEITTGVVLAEDFPQQELIHVNLRSGLLPELIFGRNEPGLIHFHQSLAAALS
jgi:hypothetical protein